MKQQMLAAGLLVAGIGGAWAQNLPSADRLTPAVPAGDVVEQRQSGLRRMQQHLEAVKAVVDARGDVSTVAARAGEMQSFFVSFWAISKISSGA